MSDDTRLSELSTPPFSIEPSHAERMEKLRIAKKAEALFDRLKVSPRLKNGSWGNVLEALCAIIVVAVEEERAE